MNVGGAGDALARAAKRSRHEEGAERGAEKTGQDFVEVEGFALSADGTRRLARLEQRLSLRDPSHFRVELYAGFWAHGVLEVLENALRSLAEKKFSSLRECLGPLSAFLRRHVARCVVELDEESRNFLESVADCIAALWRVALLAEAPEAPEEASLRQFAETLARCDVYAHFEFLAVRDSADSANDLRNAARERILHHLSRRCPWQQTDGEKMMRAKEMVITEEMLAGLRSPSNAAAVSVARPTPTKVKSALRNMR